MRELVESITADLEAEIERRAAERAEALCAERVRSGRYVEVVSEQDEALAARYGLTRGRP